jgi:hypothetical protein
MEHIKRTYKKEDAMLRPHVENSYEKQAKERAERRKKIQEQLNKTVKDRF